MIRYTKGNLLEANTQAIVNTVNTVGVMGKGIALMFKERYPINMELYSDACKSKQIHTGKMFITQTNELMGPQWIVNFPTKEHWRSPSKMSWIIDGLQDLKKFLIKEKIKSIAIPPLGAGNGRLNWNEVRVEIERTFSDLTNTDIMVYEPTKTYQNVAKRKGVEKLTPARALIAELVRSYWVLGMECSLLEIQKLAWFLQKAIKEFASDTKDPLKLHFEANKFGPYADNLRHLLGHLDGSYLKCDKRINDAAPTDVIWFNEAKKDFLFTYLKSGAITPYKSAFDYTLKLIDGFESPYGMELLATVDWLVNKENIEPKVESVHDGMKKWSTGAKSAKRKAKLFDKRAISLALERLNSLKVAM